MANEHIRAQVNEFYGKAGDLWRLEKLGGTDAELLSHARRVGRELCVLLCVLEKELEGCEVPPPGYGAPRVAEVLVALEGARCALHQAWRPGTNGEPVSPHALINEVIDSELRKPREG